MVKKEVAEVGAHPFLKWAGGKKQLLSEILSRLPKEMDTYYEPFVGGGAVFFALANEGRFKQAVISDANPLLMNTYTMIKFEVEGLIQKLEEWEPHKLDPEFYYTLRAKKLSEMSYLEASARLLFLNKTCFNGLYRVNRKGEFNVPFGKYKNPNIVNAKNLRAVSKVLKNVSIERSDFEVQTSRMNEGDVAYFDPPYVPLSETANFTSYSENGFTYDAQVRLAREFDDADARGVFVLASNSYTRTSRALYKDHRIYVVEASRAINSNASKRGPVKEILVVGKRSASEWTRVKRREFVLDL